MHSHQPQHHDPDVDWAAMAADVTLEGEVLMPYLTKSGFGTVIRYGR
jgi:hypothetical protein